MPTTSTQKRVSKVVLHVRKAQELLNDSSRFNNISQLGRQALRLLFDCYLDVCPEHLQERTFTREEVASHWAAEELQKRNPTCNLEDHSDELSDLFELFKASLQSAAIEVYGDSKLSGHQAVAIAARYELTEERARTVEGVLMRFFLTVYGDVPIFDFFESNGRLKLGSRLDYAEQIATARITNDENLTSLDPQMIHQAFAFAKELAKLVMQRV